MPSRRDRARGLAGRLARRAARGVLPEGGVRQAAARVVERTADRVAGRLRGPSTPEPPSTPPPTPPPPPPEEPSDSQILKRLSEIATQTQQLYSMLQQRGLGDAAQAVLGTPVPMPPGMESVIPPGAPPEKPIAPEAPPAPPAPPAEPPPPPSEPPLPPEKKEPTPTVLQGSIMLIPLMPARKSFDVTWREWRRAGIGVDRNPAASDQRDATGRLRGDPVSDAMPYRPNVSVVLPGRGGSISVPADRFASEDAFVDFLDGWGVSPDDRIAIEIEGMSRAGSPVASKTVWEAPTDGEED